MTCDVSPTVNLTHHENRGADLTRLQRTQLLSFELSRSRLLIAYKVGQLRLIRQWL